MQAAGCLSVCMHETNTELQYECCTWWPLGSGMAPGSCWARRMTAGGRLSLERTSSGAGATGADAPGAGDAGRGGVGAWLPGA